MHSSRLCVRRWIALILALLAFQQASHAQIREHRAAGLIFDSCSLRDPSTGTIYQWCVEEGGRVRHRRSDLHNNRWVFQDVPDALKDMLRRPFFLDPLNGWVVGQAGGWAWTMDGGTTWIAGSQIYTGLDGDPGNPQHNPTTGHEPADLYDVHFLPSGHGWLLGTKTIWETADWGATWRPATVAAGYPNSAIEYYSLDFAQLQDGSWILLASAEPGIAVIGTHAGTLPSTPPLLSYTVPLDVQRRFCPTPQDWPECSRVICREPVPGIKSIYEPWGVKIIVNPAAAATVKSLLLVTGGVGSQCAITFSSIDEGVSWNRDTYECEPGPPFTPSLACDASPDYYCPGDTYTSTMKRLCDYKTAYDVDGYSDGTAITVGYNSQMCVREDGFASPGVWKDRSTFTSAFLNPDAVVLPLIGISTYEDGSGGRYSLVTGPGGYIRENDTSWDTWVNSKSAINHPLYNPDRLPHDPWRLRDVHFRNATTGWRVGQFARIAKTIDSGFLWEEQLPAPSQSAPYLNSITMAPDGLRGVTVGSVATSTGQPVIYFNEHVDQNPAWSVPSSILGQANRDLLDVAWGGDTAQGVGNFWAVGSLGLVMFSADNGQGWSVVTPPAPWDSNPHLLTQLSGVAFSNFTGIIVGKGHYPGTGGASDPVRGIALRRNSNGTWTDLTPTDPNLVLLHITAVAIGGTTAWAVGEKQVGGDVEGVVLKYSGGPGFVEVNTGVPMPQCKTGKDIGELPVLLAVAVAANGDVWASGSCGRTLVGTSNGTSWAEVKSLTSTHVRNLSFTSDASGYVGYLAGHRDDENTMQAIIRVQEE